jgi:hypothetical protein
MNTLQTLLLAGAVALTGGVQAAAPDWSKVPAKDITLFYPGTSSIEWAVTGTEHGGARALKKGEACAGCHHEETADMGQKIVSGQKNEPTPPAGKAGSVPVKVQAAHDGTNVYLRVTWTQPAGGSQPPMDKDNAVKFAVMLDTHKVPRADLTGCWETCHKDARTMPGVTDNNKTKYVTGASLAGGVFYDILQWASKSGKHDGYIAEKRVMDGGTALVDAKGEKKGDVWTVTFTRKLSGGTGDVTLAPGQTANIGFALHDNHAGGRFHYVSLGYTLGLDAEADIVAAKR